MNRAIFLDRDGVINRKGSSYYIFNEDDFIFNEGVASALKYFRSKGFLLLIITNQGGVAKGVFSEEQLKKLHRKMRRMLKKESADVNDIFYCPHHPDISPCLCRKPGTLLFEIAVKKYNIDTASSFMIGDSETDMIAAERMGLGAILIPVNGNMMDTVIAKGLI